MTYTSTVNIPHIEMYFSPSNSSVYITLSDINKELDKIISILGNEECDTLKEISNSVRNISNVPLSNVVALYNVYFELCNLRELLYHGNFNMCDVNKALGIISVALCDIC